MGAGSSSRRASGESSRAKIRAVARLSMSRTRATDGSEEEDDADSAQQQQHFKLDVDAPLRDELTARAPIDGPDQIGGGDPSWSHESNKDEHDALLNQ